MPVIVSGERRWQAAQVLGMPTIPVSVWRGSSLRSPGREHPAAGFDRRGGGRGTPRLIDQEGYTQGQLGAIVGKARTTVSDVLSITVCLSRYVMSAAVIIR